MTEQPTLGVRVANLAASIAFYIDRIGFTLAEQQPVGTDIACIIDSDGDPLLLTGPQVGDITAYLAKNHYILSVGETMRFHGGDLNARRATFLQRGIEDVEVVEMRWGDRALNLKDPDGYMLSFYVPAERSPEEGFALYTRGVDELEAALAGLTAADLDLARAPGEWSIRAIVHHLADSDILFLPGMKMALAESGSTYHSNWPGGNEVVAESLDYAGRSIEPSVALFKAAHAYIMQLVQHVPGAWERYVQNPEGHKRTFSSFVNGVAVHVLEHVDEILEIRRVHGR